KACAYHNAASHRRGGQDRIELARDVGQVAPVELRLAVGRHLGLSVVAVVVITRMGDSNLLARCISSNADVSVPDNVYIAAGIGDAFDGYKSSNLSGRSVVRVVFVVDVVADRLVELRQVDAIDGACHRQIACDGAAGDTKVSVVMQMIGPGDKEARARIA